jgi:DNA-binding winged helix-turn-helix (wHTH) protein
MSLSPHRLYDFGPFRLEPAERLLLRDGQTVSLPPKAYDLLVTLVAHAGHLATKEDLLREVWPGTFVEEANLSYTVSLVRKALGDDREPFRYIETVPKRGYRFKEPVAPPEAVDAPELRARHTGRRLTGAVAALIAGVAVTVTWL